MNIKWLASAFVCTTLAYCGGGSGGGGGGGSSGVDSDKAIGELSTSELQDLCEYFATVQEQPAREVVCGDGTTITVGVNPEDVQAQIDDCVAEAPVGTCDATVGEAEACFEALDTQGLTDAEVCELLLGETPPAACAPLFNNPNCE